MPGCARIYGSLHMAIQTEELIENLKALSNDLCWCYFNILSTQYHRVAFITHDEYAAVFFGEV